MCRKVTRTTSCTVNVARFDVSSLACSVYNWALSAKNLYLAFTKTGISHFNKSVISKECTIPVDGFIENENCEKVEEETPDNDNILKRVDDYPNQSMNAKSPSSIFSSKLDSIS